MQDNKTCEICGKSDERMVAFVMVVSEEIPAPKHICVGCLTKTVAKEQQ